MLPPFPLHVRPLYCSVTSPYLTWVFLSVTRRSVALPAQQKRPLPTSSSSHAPEVRFSPEERAVQHLSGISKEWVPYKRVPRLRAPHP